MHVYLREEPVEMGMRRVAAEGMVPEESGLVAVAFFMKENEQPSFRTLLPPETLAVLEEATSVPVQLGLLAEEPENPQDEIRAMVGISVAVSKMPGDAGEIQGEAEPWKAGREDPDAWKGKDRKEYAPFPRTALLAFAPLVRLSRKSPDDFGAELADLLESALAGATKPSLEARVDQVLGDL